jgi:predicted transcriptional regulator
MKDSSMPKKLIEIATEIVQTQVSITPMSGADIASSLRQVFVTLRELQRAESGEIELPKIQEAVPAQALTPKDSIQNDKVICLECGAEMKQLTSKHLLSHDMSPKEYRKKYGFTMKTPLMAKSLTKAKSKAAKKRGLPQELQKYMEARRQEKAKATKPAAESSRPATEKATVKPAATKKTTPSKSSARAQNSIQDDKIICLECGGEFKQLTGRHLASHSLTPTEYKKKYGFSMNTPLLAKSVTKAMSEAQQKRGLAENPKKAIAVKKQAKAPVTESLSDGPGAQRAKRVKRLFSPKKIG